MKTIKRTKKMPDSAKYIYCTVDSSILWNYATSYDDYIIKKQEVVCNVCSWYKITDKPTRKELHAEIAKLNKIINEDRKLSKYYENEADKFTNASCDYFHRYKDVVKQLLVSQQHNKELQSKIEEIENILKNHR